MELTREEAIRNFREHWASLAITGASQSQKGEYLIRHGIKDIRHDCFLCEYVRENSCSQCPIEWARTNNRTTQPCMQSHYGDWTGAHTPEERKRLAAIIRDLPEKVEKKEPKPDFKIGDWVKVLESRYSFPQYEGFFQKNGLQEYLLKWAKKDTVNGEVYQIVAIGKHESQQDYCGPIYVLQSPNGDIYIMHYGYNESRRKSPGFELTTPPPKFAIGDKVVPVNKSVGYNTFETVKDQIQKSDDKYLIVKSLDGRNHDEPGVIWAESCSLSYSFKESDLIPYVEPEKKEEPKPAFKVGDRVKVKADLVVDGLYDNGCYFTALMTSWVGKTTTIEAISNFGSGNRHKLKGFSNYWSESMLELLPPINYCPEPKTFIEYGATFIFRDNVTVCIIETDGYKFKGIAKCRPEDTWNEAVGKGWAGTRALRQVIETTEAQLKAM